MSFTDSSFRSRRPASSPPRKIICSEALRLTELGPRAEDIDAAWADLSAAEAELTQARRRLEDARLVAPGAGVIRTRAREVGAIVLATIAARVGFADEAHFARHFKRLVGVTPGRFR